MKNKTKTDLVLARRIRAAGCPIYIEEDDGGARYIPSGGLRVYQTGGAFESAAFDWGCGTGFKVHLVITNNRPAFAISRFALELPWKTTSIQFLEDPRVIDGPSQYYRFIGGHVLEFERGQVINQFADVTQTFSSGESVRGFLLAYGYEAIPPEFPHGAMIPAFVVLYDQFAREFRTPVKLWADRNKKPIHDPRFGVRRKGGLLDKRDPIARG
jgi:hypothetical protein